VSPASLLVLLAAAGIVLAAISALGIRAAGGHPRMARRLAGAREVPVGSLLDDGGRPNRPVRVTGRIRCRDPLHVPGGEPLVAYHRDVEVRLPGVGWRSVERLRETRSFQLWDHDGSVTVDPARAAEPLIALPSVWRGAATELVEPHASAVRVLERRHGAALEARATTRAIHVTDRLLILASARGSGANTSLEPPAGGYVVSALPLADAMRLLGGRRRLMAGSMIGVGLGVLLTVIGLVGALATLALRG
jgi:hypothetical protein